jgi:hypothetical protein
MVKIPQYESRRVRPRNPDLPEKFLLRYSMGSHFKNQWFSAAFHKSGSHTGMSVRC